VKSLRNLGSFVGGAIYGMLVFGIWPEMWQTYGVFGGWVAGLFVAGIGWFLNHYIGLIYNQPDAATVDMGCGAATAGTVWLMVKDGLALGPAIPSIILCIIGGAIGGLMAGVFTKEIDQPK
jgi:ABC-type antimicrobial peptide transport system permease subunit